MRSIFPFLSKNTRSGFRKVKKVWTDRQSGKKRPSTPSGQRLRTMIPQKRELKFSARRIF